MDAFANYEDHDALSLAELIRRREVSTLEVLREARPSFNAEALKWDIFTIVGCNWLLALQQ